jgi:MFS family permease
VKALAWSWANRAERARKTQTWFRSAGVYFARSMQLPERTAITFRHERWRALSAGVLETASMTFLLIIAVRWFHAGSTAKALVAGGGSFGLFLTPLIVSYVARIGWTASKAASALAIFGAAWFALMAAIPVLPLFVVGSMLAMAASSGAVPLFTHMYHDNYPEKIRGQLFSSTVMIRIAAAAVFSEAAGRFLFADMARYRWLLVIFAFAFALAAVHLWKCPTTRITREDGAHPFRALGYLRTDRILRVTLAAWMLMGTANLMMLPMRVEYLANPKYGMNLSVVEVAFLTGVIPNVARLILSPVWGWLFDRMNFFVLRAALNVGFAVGILSFFTSESLAGLLAGGIIFGASNAGGDIAWSLWVTKFSPPERVADYMSVHTFFTGVRGVAAPMLAFHLTNRYSMAGLGIASAILIFLSILFLIPEMKFGRGKLKPALVEEVSE